MHELQNTGVHDAAPDTVTYNTVIGAYARVTNKVNKDTPLRAEKVLRDMIHFCNNGKPLVAPDHRSYNHLISAWMKTKQPSSSNRADWWLHRMWEKYNETGNEIIRSSVHIYNTVMADFAHLGHTVKVKHLMVDVLDHKGSKDTSLRPNTDSFSLVIKSWITNGAGSSISNMGERMRYVLDADTIFR